MSAMLLLLLAGCGEPRVVVDEVVRVDAPIVDDSPELIPLRDRYIAAVCRVYTEPGCVASQKDTCPTQATFPSAQSCFDNLKGQSNECEGLTAAFVTHKAQVSACINRLDATTCSVSSPFCSADGVRLDVTGPCAAVTQIVSRCARRGDTGI